MKENRQGCLSRFIRAQTGPLRRLCTPHRTKKKKTPKGVFFFLVRKMGLEPTRIKRYMRKMQYLSGFFVLFSCTKGIKNTLSE